MIVRSCSRRSPSFHQLLAYLTADGRTADIPPISRNLFSPGIPAPDDPPGAPAAPGPAYREVADEFLANARHLPPRKNGVVLYHEILSFAKADRPRLTPGMLAGLARFYLQERAPDALAFGVVHTDRENLHVHLVISANPRDRPCRHRLSKFQFARVKRETERLQRSLYPELIHSRVSHGPSPEQKRHQRREQECADAPRLTHAEHQRERRLEPQTKREPSRKELLRQQALAALVASRSPADFRARLRARGLGAYERNGRLQGVIPQDGPDPSGHNKYRFTTLGLGPALETAREGWQRYPGNRLLLDDACAEKFRRNFRREYGYHRDIADVLAPAPQPGPLPGMVPRLPEPPARPGREEGNAAGETSETDADAEAAGSGSNEEAERGTAPPASVRVRAAASLRALFTRKRRHARDAPGGRDRTRDP